MGAAYAACVLGVDEPSVGLLSNGTEEHKGSALHAVLLSAHGGARSRFCRQLRGRGYHSGSVDVVVCNGFDGNIALKSIEGAAKFMMGELKAGMTANLKGKVAALLMRNMLRTLKHKLSGDAKGGALLLGLRGVVMIGHGATSAEAVKNGHACLRGGGARTPCRTRPGVHGARGVASLHPTYIPRLFACSRAGVFIPCACGGACFVEMRTLRRFPCARPRALLGVE